jgi:hypothetical protein
LNQLSQSHLDIDLEMDALFLSPLERRILITLTWIYNGINLYGVFCKYFWNKTGRVRYEVQLQVRVGRG